MCSFTVLGGPPGLVRKPVSIWCDHHLPSPSHRVDQVVDCCWILAGTGTRCRIRQSRASQTCSMGDMSGEYAGHARTGMFSASRNCVQILATWGRALSCCNMRWWSWMNGTSMGLRISSQYLCAFKMPSIKMHLCSLSITYACPYHNPTATMGHSLDPQRWHQQTAHPHDAIHAVCHLPCTVPDVIECEHLPTQVGYDDELQSGRDPDEDDEHADELPWDRFWKFVQIFFSYANRLLQQLSGWLVSDDLGGEDAGCGGPGLVWLHMLCDCEAGWMYCQILWNAFGDGLW